MAAEEGLIIGIGADTSDLESGINAAKKSVQDFSGALQGALSEATGQLSDLNSKLENLQFEKAFGDGSTSASALNKEIAQTKLQINLVTKEIEQYKGAMSGATNQSDSMRNVMMATNRVIRDSHSLLYSTNRGIAELTYALPNLAAKLGEVKAETGSWNSALGLLGSTLFSWQSALFIAGTALAMFLRHHKEAKESVTSLNDSIKDEASAISLAEKEYVKTSSAVDSVKESIELAKQGIISKKDAIAEYNKELGNALGKVTSLEAAEKSITDKGPAFIQMTMLKAAANLAYEAAAKKAFEAAQAHAKAEADAFKESANLAQKAIAFGAGNNSAPGFVPNQTGSTKLKTDYIKSEGEAIKKAQEKSANDQKSNLEKIGNDLMKQAADIAKKSNIKFLDELKDPKTPKPKKDKEEHLRKVDGITLEQKAMQEYGIALKDIAVKENALGKNLNSEKIRATEQAIDKLMKAGANPAADHNLKSLILDLKNYEAQADLSARKAPAMQRDMATQSQKFAEANQEIQEKLQKEADFIDNTLAPAFTNFFSGLADGADVSLNSVIKDIAKMIEKLAAAAAAAEVLNLLLAASGLGAGSSLLGSAKAGTSEGFMSIFKKITGFASGGVVPPGYSNDTYLARLSSGESVLTPAQLKAVASSGAGSQSGFVARTEISGNALGIVIERANRSRGRTY
jgi:hypothetical protein